MIVAAASTSYPLLNIFWTMLEFFAWVAWFWLVIYVLTDVFRNPDLSGGSKALWVLLVFFIPLFGALVYLIVHGDDMHERSGRRVSRQYGDRRDYTPGASGPAASTADQLQDLADARDRGTISAQEFERQKAAILA